MRIDWYTKGVLTVIAVLLALIAFRHYVSPDTVVRADGPFAGVQFTSWPIDSFFDTRTGERWNYRDYQKPTRCRVAKLGGPMVCDKLGKGDAHGPPIS